MTETTVSASTLGGARQPGRHRQFAGWMGMMLAGGFTVLGLLALLVPFNPVMPAPGLDPAWTQVMAHAVATGMRLGTDIIFTFGPYAGLYTGVFNAVTDTLTTVTALFFAAVYACLVLQLFSASRLVAAPALVGLLMVFAWLKDSVFLAYPLFLVLLAARQGQADTTSDPVSRAGLPALAAQWFFYLLPCGLLPLVKGSFLAPIALMLVALAWLLRRNHALLLMAMTLPILSATGFWIISGQRLADLPIFISSLSQIVAGYTSAMMLVANSAPQLAVYLVAAVLCCLSILKGFRKSGWRTTVPVTLSLLLYVYIVLKAAFVRHDAHALIASTALLILAMLALGLGAGRKASLSIASIGIVAGLMIFARYASINVATVKARWHELVVVGGQAAGTRWRDPSHFARMTDAAWAQLRQTHPLPSLDGTADVYSTGQTELLASGNRWNPRPVFQSYSAYTPALADLNRDHLLAAGAPDYIFFSMAPIDERYPAIEDGPSWPVIVDRYAFEAHEGPFLLLKRRAKPFGSNNGVPINLTAGLGEEVAVPSAADMVIADINVSLNLIGRLAQTFYKPSVLQLHVTLRSGEKKTYRFVAGMGSNFMLSPLIKSDHDFKLLMQRELPALEAQKVESFSISADGGRYFWAQKINVRLTPVSMALAR